MHPSLRASDLSNLAELSTAIGTAGTFNVLSRVQAEVPLHLVVPSIVLLRAPVNPLLVVHPRAPAKKRAGISARRMTQLPRAALDDISDDSGSLIRGNGIGQRRTEHPR